MIQKEGDILDRCGLPLNGFKLRVFNIVIYGKIIRCSFKPFEQFIYNIHFCVSYNKL